jgi:hypothetical protein
VWDISIRTRLEDARASAGKQLLLAGTWSCQGAFNNKKTEPASGYVAKYFIGYDPRQKQLVEFDANTFEAGVYASETGSSS